MAYIRAEDSDGARDMLRQMESRLQPMSLSRSSAPFGLYLHAFLLGPFCEGSDETLQPSHSALLDNVRVAHEYIFMQQSLVPGSCTEAGTLFQGIAGSSNRAQQLGGGG